MSVSKRKRLISIIGAISVAMLTMYGVAATSFVPATAANASATTYRFQDSHWYQLGRDESQYDDNSLASLAAQQSAADAADPAAVSFTRIDTPNPPTRFVSGITVDPNDPNHAFVSFSMHTKARFPRGSPAFLVVGPDSPSMTGATAYPFRFGLVSGPLPLPPPDGTLALRPLDADSAPDGSRTSPRRGEGH